MNQARLLQVLIAPHISEKGTVIADKNSQFIFKVAPDATKPEVKAAVESLFNVKVKSVQMIKMKGKRKNFGRVQGKRKDWKKAYVGLEQGYDIDFMGVE